MKRRPSVAIRRWTPHAAREWQKIRERVHWDGVELAEPEREPTDASVEELLALLCADGEHVGLGEHIEAELRRQGRRLDDLLPRTWAWECSADDWREWNLRPPWSTPRRDDRDFGLAVLPPCVFPTGSYSPQAM